MSVILFLYLADMFNNLSGICCIALFIALITLAVLSFMSLNCTGDRDYEKEARARVNKLIRLFLKILVPLVLVVIFVPDAKTMYLMMGAEYLNKSDIPVKVEKIINNKLDYYLTNDTDAKEKQK